MTIDIVPSPESVQVNQAPCFIFLTNGKVFIVKSIGGWTYVPQGIFATGHFDPLAEDEIDLLIPEHSVDYIELDFKALEQHLAKSPGT